MHERNAHNFPLDLAAADSTPVALTAPTIGWVILNKHTRSVLFGPFFYAQK
jgi:hypothetical protein